MMASTAATTAIYNPGIATRVEIDARGYARYGFRVEKCDALPSPAVDDDDDDPSGRSSGGVVEGGGGVGGGEGARGMEEVVASSVVPNIETELEPETSPRRTEGEGVHAPRRRPAGKKKKRKPGTTKRRRRKRSRDGGTAC